MSSNSGNNSESANLQVGDRVGAYRVEHLLGSGGMADVYYAIHVGLERPSALKVLRPMLASDETHLQRFLQEARAAASLVHPNIVQVYDVGQDGALQYIAQEYIPGSNLRQYLSSSPVAGPTDARPLAEKAGTDKAQFNSQRPTNYDKTTDRQLAISETLSILLQILAALCKSTSSGIVHRDIKPENIMLTPEGDVKVADFGLARVLLGDDPQLTRAGTTLGTPMYMSPEQLQEGAVDIRSDLYSLGVTLFHMLSGRPPFTGETPLALAMQHVQAAVPDLRQFRSNIPNSLVELVNRLLAKSPADRFANPQEALQFLRSHRAADLSDDWPEHTIPLPGAAIAGRMGPSRATLMLQEKLRQTKRGRWKRGFSGAAAIGVMLAAFAAGNAFPYSSPVDMLSLPDKGDDSIPHMPSVQEQYRWALFDTQTDRLAKWLAVEKYFPRERLEIFRLYGGLADLQLARVHRDANESQNARELLDRILGDSKMPDLVKAYAYLEIANMEDLAQNREKVQNALQEARKIREADDFNYRDREQLDGAVSLMSSYAQMLWFGMSNP